MKVLIICSQYPPQQGGGGTHTFYLAAELERLGCEVHVLTACAENAPATSKIPSKKLWIHRIEFGPKSVLSSAEPLRAALRLCRDLAPDIVHGQHLQGANTALRLKAAFGIPVVVTLHKTPRFDFGAEQAARDPVYAEIRFLGSLGLCDCFVAGSRAFQEELLRVAGGQLSRRRVRLIYHGVSHGWLRYRAFRSAKRPSDLGLDLRRGEKLIICPARIDKRKNLHAFVSAAAALARALPEERFKLLITGEPQDREEERRRRAIQAHADSLGIGRELMFRSFDFYRLPGLFRFAKACVLPSYKEGLGLVLLEALALGVPTVATRTTGIDEIIQKDEAGALLFEIGDEEELAEQLVRIMTEPGLVGRLREAGLRIVRERFSADRMAREHLTLYRELTARPRESVRQSEADNPSEPRAGQG